MNTNYLGDNILDLVVYVYDGTRTAKHFGIQELTELPGQRRIVKDPHGGDGSDETEI